MTENQPERKRQNKKPWVIPGGKLQIMEEVWHVRETRLRTAPLETDTRETLKRSIEKIIFEGTSTDGE